MRPNRAHWGKHAASCEPENYRQGCRRLSWLFLIGSCSVRKAMNSRESSTCQRDVYSAYASLRNVCYFPSLVRIDLKLYCMNNVNLAMNMWWTIKDWDSDNLFTFMNLDTHCRYNMPPGLADTPGDPSMVVDMANEKDITEDRTIASTQMPGGQACRTAQEFGKTWTWSTSCVSVHVKNFGTFSPVSDLAYWGNSSELSWDSVGKFAHARRRMIVTT